MITHSCFAAVLTLLLAPGSALALTTLITSKGVPSSAQNYKSTYDQSQTAYDPVTKVAFLPYMEDPDPASTAEAYKNYMVLYDMENRQIINSRYYIGSAKIADPHNAAWIHVDAAGYVHITYGCHNSTCYYIRSNLPHDRTLAGGFTAERALFGKATYPRIFSDPNDAKKLCIIYRGQPNPSPSNEPHKYLTAARSTDGGATWTQHVFVNYDAAGTSPMVYASGKMAPDGTLHVAWSWRPTTTGGNIQNGVSYAKSTDFGLTWKKSNGTSYSLPIKHTTAELIETNLSHTVMWNWPIDQNGYPVIFHWYKQNSFWFTRWNGSSWVKKKVISSSFQDKADYLQANMNSDGSMEIIGHKVINIAADPDVLEIFRIRSADNGTTWGTTMKTLARDPAVPQSINYVYPIMVYDNRISSNVYLYSTYQKKVFLLDELGGATPGVNLLTNSTFETAPLDSGWTNDGAKIVQGGLTSASAKSVRLDAANQRFHQASLASMKNFAVDFHFALSTVGRRTLNFRVFPNRQATGSEILNFKYQNGTLSAYNGATWIPLLKATLRPSRDGNSSGILGDHASDVRHTYRLRLTARNFGASAARYDIALLHEDGSLIAAALDQTTWHTEATLHSAAAIEFNTLHGDPYWVDDVRQTYTSEPATTFHDWAEAMGLNPTAPGQTANDDTDGDGLTNAVEHAFGQHPLAPSPSPAVASPLSSSNGVFRYTRRDPAISGLTYLIETSPDLVAWTPDPQATQTILTSGGGIQHIEVRLSPARLRSGKLYIQVTAQ